MLLDFDDGDPVKILVPKAPGFTDPGGIVVDGIANYVLSTKVGGGTGLVDGRISTPSPKQIRAWRSLGIEVNYALYTKEPGIQNGMFATAGDGRLFRIVGTGGAWYAIGTFDENYYQYPLVFAGNL